MDSCFSLQCSSMCEIILFVEGSAVLGGIVVSKYKIGKVSELMAISINTLRYYESLGL